MKVKLIQRQPHPGQFSGKLFCRVVEAFELKELTLSLRLPQLRVELFLG